MTRTPNRGTPPADPADRAGPAVGWICSGTPVPPGWVLVAHRAGCGGIGAWFTQLAKPGLWMCRYQPVPAGFHTTTFNGTACNGVGASLLVRN